MTDFRTGALLIAQEWDPVGRSLVEILPPSLLLSEVAGQTLVGFSAVYGWLGSPPIRLEVVDVTEGRNRRVVCKTEPRSLSPVEALDLDPKLHMEFVWELPAWDHSLAGSFAFQIVVEDNNDPNGWRSVGERRLLVREPE